ncbi:uncharacterized protein LTR77_002329 [Saxophila tyrrhenica]|uniref:Uncharacterized protein n=1 Tax=Saxophila tyrrhenica TaxID=1690608 RepID=A0AAV9PN32_9PEZI|nr:hypothetical protein LTR77_002329 [Saxophila tyrrhenica]
MEEDPKDHDFDQRHDGPIQPAQPRPSVQIQTDMPRRTVSDQDHNTSKKSKSQPDAFSPMTAPPERRSMQLDRSERRSTQISRSGTWGRQSRDFDQRRDGPFGRPSLTMTRRRSSQMSMGVASPDRAPTMPVEDDSAVVDSDNNRDDGPPPSDQVPPSVETMQSSDHAFEPEPPPLNYSLISRKWSILWFWSLILIDSIAMPIVLYFCLWYYTDLSPNTVFSIVTAALGGISIFEYFIRFYRLWKKGSTCRVIGARRMYLDWFHWNFTLAWVIIMIELIVGTVPEHPPIRLVAMPLASMVYTFGTELMIIDIMRYFQMPAPCRISSIPKGAQLRPGIYSIIEDVIAVDGSGGTEYREALNRRYEASHIFRAMLRRLGMYWAVGAQGCAVLTTILIFTLSEDAAYSVGWSLPFVWAGFWTIGTFWYVNRKLKEEKKAWQEEVAVRMEEGKVPAVAA